MTNCGSRPQHYGPCQVQDLSGSSGLTTGFGATGCEWPRSQWDDNQYACVVRGTSTAEHPTAELGESHSPVSPTSTHKQQRRFSDAVMGNSLGRDEGFNSPCCHYGAESQTRLFNPCDLAVRHSRRTKVLWNYKPYNNGT